MKSKIKQGIFTLSKVFKQNCSRAKFIRNLKKDLISRVSAVIISHPFHVITIRMMAQFVGHETKYRFDIIHPYILSIMILIYIIIVAYLVP